MLGPHVVILYTCPAGPLMPTLWQSCPLIPVLKISCIPSLRRRVLSHWWPSTSSIQSASIYESRRSSWVFVTRRRVYAGGQLTGSYSKQLRRFPENDFDVDSDDDDGACCPGMVTPSLPPSRHVLSISGQGCPQPGCIVRPSAMLPTTSVPTHALWRPSSDSNVERVTVFLHTWVYGSRYMVQVGKTTSRITSHKACDGTKYVLT